MQNKIKIPKNQQSWVRYIKNERVTHLITSTMIRDKYFLYKVNEDGRLEKLASSKTPIFKEINL